MYGAWEQYLGLEHPDTAPRKAHTANQVPHVTLSRTILGLDAVIMTIFCVLFLAEISLIA
jgi:hypothetical protein